DARPPRHPRALGSRHPQRRHDLRHDEPRHRADGAHAPRHPGAADHEGARPLRGLGASDDDARRAPAGGRGVMRLANLALSAAVLAGCGSAAMPGYDYSKEFDPRGKEYHIGVGDSLVINVFHQPDMSSTVTVRPDGIVTMPLVGDMSVAG